MHMTKYDIARSSHRIASVFFYCEHKINPCNEISYNESKNDTYDDKSEIGIHTKLLN